MPAAGGSGESERRMVLDFGASWATWGEEMGLQLGPGPPLPNFLALHLSPGGWRQLDLEEKGTWRSGTEKAVPQEGGICGNKE